MVAPVRSRAGCLLVVAACSALTACAAPTVPQARAALDHHVEQCSERYGLDPESSEGAGPHEILPAERPWRECVYAGIETLVVPYTSMPGLYRSLVREDRRMTDDIEAGRLTRAERRQRLDALLAVLEARERAYAEQREQQALDNARAFEWQQRQFNEQEDRIRRSLVLPLGR